MFLSLGICNTRSKLQECLLCIHAASIKDWSGANPLGYGLKKPKINIPEGSRFWKNRSGWWLLSSFNIGDGISFALWEFGFAECVCIV